MIITDIGKITQESKEASLFEAIEIISTLEKELFGSEMPGIGLASIQIGIRKKVAIIRMPNLSLDLVNPIIVNKYDLSEFDGEGCLSFPGQAIITKRYAEIVVKDLMHPAGIILIGIEAVVVAHEIDHLYGKTMFDSQIVRPKRNEKCWCGQKKYKKCHMNNTIDIRN